jgi:hypothetical protein
MLNIAKYALGSLLVAQGRHVRQTALHLPEARGPRIGVKIVPDATRDAVPIRLLFVGDSSAAGVGVDWHDKALAQQAARHLNAASGRRVQW